MTPVCEGCGQPIEPGRHRRWREIAPGVGRLLCRRCVRALEKAQGGR